MKSYQHSVAAVFLLLLPVVPVSAAKLEALTVCEQLQATLPSKVAYGSNSSFSNLSSVSLSASYLEARSRYWDAANADDTPACAFFPSTAQDVSIAMKLLNAAPNVPFALKSGGHNFNRGFSSTDGGVLISFRPNMNYTKLLPGNDSAEIGPGARWIEVMSVLDQSNRCAVGGRVGDVGVGGYIPYGGLSYLTAQYGFASDNVLNFEMVLANGTIINANKTSNSDVFFAVRGGGNLFGVVTKYTVMTHPIGNVWGGEKIYTTDKAPELFSAITNYIANFNETKSALIPTVSWLSALNGSAIFTIFYFWDGDMPPSHVFAEFDAIPAAISSVKTQRYPELLDLSAVTTFVIRTSDAISSLPNMPQPQMAEFLNWHYSGLNQSSFVQSPDLKLLSMAMQPIPVALQRANFDRGPAALNTDPSAGDKLWIEYSLGWSDPVYDQTWPQELLNHVQAARNHQQINYEGVQPTNYASGDLDWAPYHPLFANDAQVGQPVLQSYGKSTYNKLRRLHATLDPTNMFLLQTKSFQF